jgi:hypothetical protein
MKKVKVKKKKRAAFLEADSAPSSLLRIQFAVWIIEASGTRDFNFHLDSSPT